MRGPRFVLAALLVGSVLSACGDASTPTTLPPLATEPTPLTTTTTSTVPPVTTTTVPPTSAAPTTLPTTTTSTEPPVVTERLTLAPGSGPAGTEVGIQGRGFSEWAGQQSVELIMGNELEADVVHTFVIPAIDEDGAFDITIQIPRRMAIPQGGGRTVVTPTVDLSIAVGRDLNVEPGALFTVTPRPAPSLQLRGDGLGDDLLFGTDADEAVAFMTAELGPPTADSGWWATDDPFNPSGGYCRGSEVRIVEWNSLSIMLAKGETPVSPSDGGGHLLFYRSQGSDPAVFTAGDVGSGDPLFYLLSEYTETLYLRGFEYSIESWNGTFSTTEWGTTSDGFGDFIAAFDGIVVLYDDHISSWTYTAGGFRFANTEPIGFWGTLSGGDGADTVTSITAGFGCGD